MPTEMELRRRGRVDLERANRPAPIDPRWEQFPASENIEDRRGDTVGSLLEMLVAPTGYNLAEWRAMLARPATPTSVTLPHRNWPYGEKR